jgi:cytochrome c oxidase subunit 4
MSSVNQSNSTKLNIVNQPVPNVINIRPCTWVWMILVLLTLGVLAIGKAGLGGIGIVLLILLSTLVKTRMVADYFMGLKRAGRLWRTIVSVYLLIVVSMIGLAYWLSLS